MPGGGGGRKKPFSGKQKKQQLLVKRERQQGREPGEYGFTARRVKMEGPGSSSGGVGEDGRHRNQFATTLQDASGLGSCKFFEMRQSATRGDPGRYALMFRKESAEEIARQKEQARKEIVPVLEEYLECGMEDFFTPELDFPVRPKWSYEESREQLERNEYKYFHEYLRCIDSKFERTDLSYFELNLETWRQLWRVLEMSDIILCIVDIRYPPLLFPPKLYDYICKELGKSLILILNKIDLCPAPLVVAWKDYFLKKYPGLQVLCFTSFPSYNLCTEKEHATALQGTRKKGKQKMAAEGALELYKVCANIVQGEVDLSSWKSKIMEEMNTTADSEDAEDSEEVQIDKIISEKADTGYYDFKKYNGGDMLTIGCVGQPNVGKSSLINALMGRKVVSVSRTPGHTKHFQTIFLTPNVRLCDCPGLIFPSKIPKALQVLCGSYPIAQLREPYSTVKYLAERLDLPKILKITHPEKELQWSACDIADGWAEKRGYYTAKAARLDTYRGANQILRLALDGRICLCLYPPGYYSSKEEWARDPRVAEIFAIQAKSQNASNYQHGQQEIEVSEDEDDYDVAEAGEQGEEEPEGESVGSEENESGDEEDDEGSTQKLKVPVKQEKKKGSGGGGSVAVKNKFALLLDDDDDDDEDEDE